jgi:hypothetical protein
MTSKPSTSASLSCSQPKVRFCLHPSPRRVTLRTVVPRWISLLVPALCVSSPALADPMPALDNVRTSLDEPAQPSSLASPRLIAASLDDGERTAIGNHRAEPRRIRST